MPALVLTPDRDVVKFDFSRVFKPESLAFMKAREMVNGQAFVRRIDVSKPKLSRFSQVLAMFDDLPGPVLVDTLVFLCHGTADANQLGLTTKNVDKLLNKWFHRAIPQSQLPLHVILYSCTNGGGAGPDGDSGLADTLRDAIYNLTGNLISVTAHSTKGHATRNPHVRRFDQPDGIGGSWIVKPGSALWPKWKKALWSKKGTMRFDFPFSSVEDIHDSLRSMR